MSVKSMTCLRSSVMRHRRPDDVDLLLLQRRDDAVPGDFDQLAVQLLVLADGLVEVHLEADPARRWRSSPRTADTALPQRRSSPSCAWAVIAENASTAPATRPPMSFFMFLSPLMCDGRSGLCLPGHSCRWPIGKARPDQLGQNPSIRKIRLGSGIHGQYAANSCDVPELSRRLRSAIRPCPGTPANRSIASPRRSSPWA